MPISPGTASIVSRTLTPSGNITVTSSTGGTPPYTYQWQTSLDNISFTSITGAVTQSYTYSPGANAIYYLRCICGDSVSASVNSNAFSVVLSSDQIFLGFIGDSITAGTISPSPPSPTTTNATISTLNSVRITAFSNQGVSGSTTATWTPGQSYYVSALSAFNSASSGIAARYVLIMLGANDCKTIALASKAAYKANILATCNDLINNGYKVILNYPIWCGDTVNRDPSLLSQYASALNELVNGRTILQGDTYGYQYFFQNQGQMNLDTVNPSQVGENNLGSLWAYGIWRAIYSTPYKARHTNKV